MTRRPQPRIVRRAPIRPRRSRFWDIPLWVGVGVVALLAIPVVATVWPA